MNAKTVEFELDGSFLILKESFVTATSLDFFCQMAYRGCHCGDQVNVKEEPTMYVMLFANIFDISVIF